MPAILVVDDNQPVRSLVRNILEHEDAWTCTEAENGKEAIAKFDQIKPDVTVIDFQMPGVNGLEASKKILKKHPRARIAMVTAFPTKQLLREAREAGLKGFCPKTSMHCIVDAVSALLKGREYFAPASD